MSRPVSSSAAGRQVISSPEEISRLYRELSLFPALSRADVGPVITSQYGGKYSNIYTGTSLYAVNSIGHYYIVFIAYSIIICNYYITVVLLLL